MNMNINANIIPGATTIGNGNTFRKTSKTAPTNVDKALS